MTGYAETSLIQEHEIEQELLRKLTSTLDALNTVLFEAHKKGLTSEVTTIDHDTVMGKQTFVKVKLLKALN